MKEKEYTKYLGALLDNQLSWGNPVSYLNLKLARDIGILTKLRKFISKHILKQSVNYSQKICNKCIFSNLANGRTSQLMFPKYLIEYQNVKIVKSKFKKEKCNENQKWKQSLYQRKQDIQIDIPLLKWSILLSILQIYWRYTSKVYLKYTPRIFQAYFNLLSYRRISILQVFIISTKEVHLMHILWN